jgi:hypothetical protein
VAAVAAAAAAAAVVAVAGVAHPAGNRTATRQFNHAGHSRQ